MPPFERSIDRHIGLWSSPDEVKNWLWLYLEALECRSLLERVERFAFYLSHAVYQWQATGSPDIDLLLFLTRSEHFLVPRVQKRILTSMTHHLELLKNPSKKDRFSLRLTELIPKLILSDHPFIQLRECCWSCDKAIAPSTLLIQQVFTERNEEAYINSRLTLAPKTVFKTATKTVNGKCAEIEAAFAECLIEKPKSSSVNGKEISTEFPFSTDAKDVLGQPIGKDIITELQSSWENYHQSKDGKIKVVLVRDAREKLESCKNRIQQRTDESWNQLVLSFTPEESDKMNRARRTAGLSSFIAPRTLFPLFGRTTEGLQLEMPLLENHLVNIVYLQKVNRCLEMLNT